MPRASSVVRRLAILLTLAIAAACGIDENGTMPDDASFFDATFDASNDTSGDAPADVVIADVIPPGCQTLDASACMDANVPDGWTLVAFSSTPTTCPNTDYSEQQLAHNLQLEAGACSCGCAPAGSYNCGGSIAYGSSCGNCGGGLNGCSGKGAADASDDGGCVTSAFNSPDIAFGTFPTATPVGVGCDASAGGGQGFSASGVTVCVPKCTADYCGAGSSFKRCIVAPAATACPAPFVPADTIGALSTATVKCNACSCGASQVGTCAGSITYYSGSNCANSLGTAAESTCHQTGGTSVVSFKYTATEPGVTCDAGGSGGSVAFNAPVAVCCLP